jgi:hypothetical protein
MIADNDDGNDNNGVEREVRPTLVRPKKIS